MLPGFRFLFIATVMSVSVMVFGLGAAALLRATHESFATFPQRRPPEQVFVKTDTSMPVIAMLRVEPEPQTAAIAAPVMSPPAISRDEPPAVASQTENVAAPPVQTAEPIIAAPDANANASPLIKDEPAARGLVAALNIPEPAPAAAPQPDTVRTTETPPTEAAAPPAAVSASEAAPPLQPASDQIAATESVKVTALSDGGDAVARIADARKKAEAAKARARDLEAAKRARAAKIAAQRRRIAVIRAREARQKLQQEQEQPFAPFFNTN